MPDLLSYGEVQKLLKELPAEPKKLLDDLVPSVVTATTIQRVLQALLKERVSIRDLPTILEGIAEAAPHSSGITRLVEHVRSRLSKQLCFQNKGEDGMLAIISLSPAWEETFNEALVGPGEEKQLALAPSRLQEFIRAVRDAFEQAARHGDSAVLLTSGAIRPYVRSLVERFRGQTVVMSQNEIHPKVRLKTVGQI
jgi:flagellar biosynthesis protein FlhA